MEIDIEERVALARKYHSEGYNCCQSVVLAYSDVAGLDTDEAARMAAPFGSGMSGLREVCGCVSGMALLAAHALPAANPADMAARRRQGALVQQLAERFRQEEGAIVCRTLLGADGSGIRHKPCSEYVADAARIFGETIAQKA